MYVFYIHYDSSVSIFCLIIAVHCYQCILLKACLPQPNFLLEIFEGKFLKEQQKID